MKNALFTQLIQSFLIFIAAAFFFGSCIGDDIIEDTVEPEVRISNIIDSIGIGTVYQFEASYFNNIGRSENIEISWQSSSPEIISITNNGLASALTSGSSMITAEVAVSENNYSDSFILFVGEETSSATGGVRKGEIKTTSSYNLKGDFELAAISNSMLRLSIADNYTATRALPGLYIYLSNNPNSISEAFEIGRVEVFEGAHFYDIDGIGLNDFSHILYYCKPFNVKVGEGVIGD